jgi:hypothetical protein
LVPLQRKGFLDSLAEVLKVGSHLRTGTPFSTAMGDSWLDVGACETVPLGYKSLSLEGKTAI